MNYEDHGPHGLGATVAQGHDNGKHHVVLDYQTKPMNSCSYVILLDEPRPLEEKPKNLICNVKIVKFQKIIALICSYLKQQPSLTGGKGNFK